MDLLYERSSDGGFPEANYFVREFNRLPQHFYNDPDHLITTRFHDWLKERFPKMAVVWSSQYMLGKDLIHNNILYRLPAPFNILVKIHAYGEYIDETKDIYDDDFHIHVYFTDANSIVEEIIDMAIKLRRKKKFTGNKISLVTNSKDGTITTKEFDIPIGNMDVELNYGKSFVPVYNKIIKRLNAKKDKGLVLLHGKPGTGKSSIIKYIAKNLKKEVIFIPPHMAESISLPGFIPFLTSHNNSVLIIEDAERIISSRDSGIDSAGVSNILNISDGILGDCLGIQIIATFNTSRSNIDEALLRKGRLIAEHEFKELSVTQANLLLEHLGKTQRTNTPLCLTEIYNIEEEEFKIQETRKTIGFNR